MNNLQNEKKMPAGKGVAAVIEMMNNIILLAAAYNQIWTIKAITTSCGKETIAFIDERSGEEKLIFHNPDDTMVEFIKDIEKRGWFEVRHDYLIEDGFNNSRVRLCENDYHCYECH